MQRYKETASVTEHPSEEGPVLILVAPDILSTTDNALYTDAQKRHFRKEIASVERFITMWRAHADECYAWVLSLSEDILEASKLPAHPAPRFGSSGYVMHCRLGVFIYRRLFRNWNFGLLKYNQNPGWVLDGFGGSSARGTEQQIDALLSLMDRLMERERSTADRLLREASILEQTHSSLCIDLNYVIAHRRLRGKCDLVPFF